MSNVCLDPVTLNLLDFYIGLAEHVYTDTHQSLPFPIPPPIPAWEGAAHNTLTGLAASENNVPGSIPLNPTQGLWTLAEALMQKHLGDMGAYQYLQQNMNAITILTELRQNVLYDDAIHYSQYIYNLAVGQGTAQYDAEIRYTQALYNQGIGYSQYIYNLAAGRANAQFAAAIANAAALYNDSIHYSQQIYNLSAQYTNAAVAPVAGEVSQVKAQLTQLIGTDIAAVVNSITAVANTAEQQVANAVKAAEAFATSAAGGVAGAAVAAAVAQLQPQINAIKTETDECLAPLCDTVTPNASQLGQLGKLLHDLTDVGLLGLVAALLTEAAHNPGQLVTDAENDLGGILRGASSGLHDLIGV